MKHDRFTLLADASVQAVRTWNTHQGMANLGLRQPQSRTLQVFVSVLMYAAGARIGYALFTNGATFEGAFTQWLMRELFVYVGGSLWSDVPLVCIASMTLAGVALYSVYRPHPYTRPVLKWSILTLLTLSLFTLWVEPYLTLVGVATEVGKQFLLAFMAFVDLGVTLAWLTGAAYLMRSINIEFTDEIVTSESARASWDWIKYALGVLLGGVTLIGLMSSIGFPELVVLSMLGMGYAWLLRCT